jgi:hypothetical protein
VNRRLEQESRFTMDRCMEPLATPRLTSLPLAALAAVALPACGNGNGGGAPDARPSESQLNVTTGSLPLYHLETNAAGMMKPRNDASAVVYLPAMRRILVVDDGGEDARPDVLPFYLADVAALFTSSPAVTETPPEGERMGSVIQQHLDAEAATFDGTYVYVMSAMELPRVKPPEVYRSFSRFRVEGTRIVDAATIRPNDALRAALRAHDAAWADKWSPLAGKDGGLNIEALAATPRPGELLVGLRSPHWGPGYLDRAGDAGAATRVGDAIVMKIDVTSFDAARLAPAVHATLDLGGLGFRGFEYSPTAKGYFIAAGAVEAGWDYDFFFWNGDPSARPVRLSDKVKEFGRLCRPESLAEVEAQGRKYLLVLSEDSGRICEEPSPVPFNYILIELNAAFLGLLGGAPGR